MAKSDRNLLPQLSLGYQTIFFFSPQIQVDLQVRDKLLLLTESSDLIPKELLQLGNILRDTIF